MLTFIFIIIFIVCILLIGVVLVQESKGGGLASSFSSANQVMGVKKTADVLEKATWGLAILLLCLCLGAAALQGTGEATELSPEESQIQDFVESETILPQQPVQQAQPIQQAQPAQEVPAN